MIPEKQSADWTSILLHGGLGLLIGGAVGLQALVDGAFLSLPFFVVGGALVGASRGARKGDRLWLNDERQDEIAQSQVSHRVLTTVSILGWVLVVCGIGAEVFLHDFHWD